MAAWGRQEGGAWEDTVSCILWSPVSQGLIGNPWRVLGRGSIWFDHLCNSHNGLKGWIWNWEAPPRSYKNSSSHGGGACSKVPLEMLIKKDGCRTISRTTLLQSASQCSGKQDAILYKSEFQVSRVRVLICSRHYNTHEEREIRENQLLLEGRS